MISFKIKTKINKDYQFIYSHFNKNLFLFLAPSNLRLLRFDGSKTGDIVHIQFSFPKEEWISEIIHDEKTENHILFIDKTHMDVNSRLCLEPIRFTLGIFKRTVRNQPTAWRTLGYIIDQANRY